MKWTMRFEGGVEIARALSQLSTRASKSVLREALLTAGAPPIQASAIARAPRDPGAPDIAEHIVVSVARGDRSEVGKAGTAAAVAIGPSTERRADQPNRRYDIQGIFLEFGTSDTKMQAFMGPAFNHEAAKTLGPIRAAMWRAIIGKGFSTRADPGGGGLL